MAPKVRLLAGRPAPNVELLIVGEVSKPCFFPCYAVLLILVHLKAEQTQPMGTPGLLCLTGSSVHLGYGSHFDDDSEVARRRCSKASSLDKASGEGEPRFHNTRVRALMWGENTVWYLPPRAPL